MKHLIWAVFHLVYRMCRRKRFWATYKKLVKRDWEPSLIQLHSQGSKLNQFGIPSLKFIFGNN